ncbi:MAG: uroporphyrinogen decarboxylase [Bacteroidetes bacterium]|nr:uroporphyrinogen decarboxylase [Bacteroidota bacterium]
MMLKNDLLLRVARGESVERPPVWLMRQAGRFLSEYRAVREKAGSFKAMIANPEFAAEVSIQPVDLVGVDAAIIFSDILVIPEAIGLDYEMAKGEGPHFPETIRSTEGLKKLHAADMDGNLKHTFDAIRLLKAELAGRVPVIGFAGAPWTIFCYMTEGGGSKGFTVPRGLVYRDPVFAHALLERITVATIAYLRGQVAAGADIVQIFDSWAGLLGRAQYAEFAAPYIDRIVRAIPEVPVIVFAKDAFHSIDLIAAMPCQVIGLDWTADPAKAAVAAPGKTLQGNLDPAALYGTPKSVEKATLEMIAAFPQGRHIVNLGHGIYPDLPRENVIAMVDTVKNFRYSPILV